VIDIAEETICKHWKNKSSKALVSICTTTYNHEKLLHEALDSFLMQKTDFAFEIILDEDCSQDKTIEVIKEYTDKFPNLLKVNLRDENVGIVRNFEENALRAESKYITMCEGDDYWIDDKKLQKQVDFLEANSQYNACFHDSLNLSKNDDGTVVTSNRIGNRIIDEDVDVKSLIYENNIPTASIVYRNNIKKFSKYFLETSKVDYALMLMIAEQGLMKYMPNNAMAVYRLHAGGIWSSKTLDYHAKEGIKFYRLLEEHFTQEKVLMDVISIKMRNEYFNLAMALVKQKKRVVSSWYLLKSKKCCSFSHKNIRYIKYLKALIKSFI